MSATGVADPAEWARAEFEGVRSGDARFDRHVPDIAARMAMFPGASLPKQMKSERQLEKTYRMLHSARVTHENLSAPHWRKTRQLAAEEPLVLMVSDGTEIDLTRWGQTMSNPGYLRKDGLGRLVHSVLAVVPKPRRVLGLAHQQVFERIPVPEGESRKQRPKEERESRVWGDALKAIGPVPDKTRWVAVGDRAGDHAQFLLDCRRLDYDYVVRLAYDRRLADEPGADPRYLLTTARTWEPACGRYLKIPGNGKRKARTAKVLVSYGQATVRVPESRETIPLWVVRVWEVMPEGEALPKGVEPVEWLLATSVPVNSLEDALERIEWYTCRWVVEDYHQCLKTGCGAEDRDFEDGDRVVRLLGFLGPLAVRLLQLREDARLNPDLPASTVADDLTVQIVAAEAGVPAEGMTVRAFWRGVARMGGFLGRRCDGEPGWKSLWTGWLRVESLARGARVYGHLRPG